MNSGTQAQKAGTRMTNQLFILHLRIDTKIFESFNPQCMKFEMLEYIDCQCLDIYWQLIASTIEGIVNDVACASYSNNITAKLLFQPIEDVVFAFAIDSTEISCQLQRHRFCP